MPHLFIQPKWLRFYENEFEIDWGDEVSEPPLAVKRRWGLKIIGHPPLTPYLGLPAKEATREQIDRYTERMRRYRPDYIYVAFPPGTLDFMPAKWREMYIEVRYTYLMDLSISEENLWKKMEKRRRNYIRKAQRDGLEVSTLKLQEVPVALRLIRKTFSRQGKRVSWLPHAGQIIETSIKEGWGRGWLVRRGETCYSFSFIVWDEETAYYLLGGYDAEHKHHGAGPLGMWEAIRFARGIGLRVFDFEGSEIPSIERYFRKFGGQLTPYYAIRYMSPRFQIIHAIYRKVKETFAKVRNFAFITCLS